jgi:hypothetical protein
LFYKQLIYLDRRGGNAEKTEEERERERIEMAS